MSAERNYDDLAAFTRAGSAGEVIFQQGDAGTDLFIVQDGRIELLYGPPNTVVGHAEAGDVFGEWSFFEHQPRDLTARALSDFRVIRLDRAAFDRITAQAKAKYASAGEHGKKAKLRLISLRAKREAERDRARSEAVARAKAEAADKARAAARGEASTDSAAKSAPWPTTKPARLTLLNVVQ